MVELKDCDILTLRRGSSRTAPPFIEPVNVLRTRQAEQHTLLPHEHAAGTAGQQEKRYRSPLRSIFSSKEQHQRFVNELSLSLQTKISMSISPTQACHLVGFLPRDTGDAAASEQAGELTTRPTSPLSHISTRSQLDLSSHTSGDSEATLYE